MSFESELQAHLHLLNKQIAALQAEAIPTMHRISRSQLARAFGTSDERAQQTIDNLGYLYRQNAADKRDAEFRARARWPVETVEHRAMRAAYCDGAASITADTTTMVTRHDDQAATDGAA